VTAPAGDGPRTDTAERLAAAYEWHITVLRRNHYGDRVVDRTPMVVLAADRAEVTAKVRAAFGATYDGFRKFWSHDWTLTEVREVAR
jgi:hypothetical protein